MKAGVANFPSRLLIPPSFLISRPLFSCPSPVIPLSRSAIPLSLPRHSRFLPRHSRESGNPYGHVRVKTGIADNVIAIPPLSCDSSERVMSAPSWVKIFARQGQDPPKVRIRIYGIMGFSGFVRRASSPGRRLFIFGLAGFSVMEKSASRARRNPVNPANTVNPDSDKTRKRGSAGGTPALPERGFAAPSPRAFSRPQPARSRRSLGGAPARPWGCGSL